MCRLAMHLFFSTYIMSDSIQMLLTTRRFSVELLKEAIFFYNMNVPLPGMSPVWSRYTYISVHTHSQRYAAALSLLYKDNGTQSEPIEFVYEQGMQSVYCGDACSVIFLLCSQFCLLG